MRKVFTYLILTAVLLPASKAHAQRSFYHSSGDYQEIVFNVGASNLMGDLGGSYLPVGTHFLRDFQLPAIRPAIAGAYRRDLVGDLMIRGQLLGCMLYG